MHVLMLHCSYDVHVVCCTPMNGLSMEFQRAPFEQKHETSMVSMLLYGNSIMLDCQWWWKQRIKLSSCMETIFVLGVSMFMSIFVFFFFPNATLFFFFFF